MSSLIMNDDHSMIRKGRVWKSVAGFSRCGCIFAIYQDDTNYSVHAGDKWDEKDEPNMGYYDKSLSYDDLISEIANTYDKIRKERLRVNTI